MKLFLLGATGASGKQILDQSLKSGIEVTAYVRHPEGLGIAREKLTPVKGELDERDKLFSAMAGHDVVVCALGYRHMFDRSRFISRTMQTVIDGMKKNGIRRLVYESAYGISDTRASLPWYMRLILKIVAGNPAADHELSEKIIRESGLDWIIVRPTMLTNGPSLGVCQIKETLPHFGHVSRADVAVFIVSNLSGERYLRKAMALAY